MKKLISISLILVTLSTFGICQSIRLKCYLINKCDNKVRPLKYYHLYKGTFLYSSMINGEEAILPDTGAYTLKSDSLATDGDSTIINIKPGLNADTILQKNIYQVYIMPEDHYAKNGHIWYGWVYCGIKKCEGYQVDYYMNGQKMLAGNFKKGQVIGTLKYFNDRGDLTFVEYYDKRSKFIRSETYKKGVIIMTAP